MEAIMDYLGVHLKTIAPILCVLTLLLLLSCEQSSGSASSQPLNYSLRGLTDVQLELPHAVDLLIEHGASPSSSNDDDENMQASISQRKTFFGVDQDGVAHYVNDTLTAGYSSFGLLEYQVHSRLNSLKRMDLGRTLMTGYLEEMLGKGCGGTGIEQVENCQTTGTLTIPSDKELLDEIWSKTPDSLKERVCTELYDCAYMDKLPGQPEELVFDKLQAGAGYQFAFRIGLSIITTAGVRSAHCDNAARVSWTPESVDTHAKLAYIIEVEHTEAQDTVACETYALLYENKDGVETYLNRVTVEFTQTHSKQRDEKTLALYEQASDYGSELTLHQNPNGHVDIQLIETFKDEFKDQAGVLNALQTAGFCHAESTTETADCSDYLQSIQTATPEYTHRILNIAGSEDYVSVQSWTSNRYPAAGTSAFVTASPLFGSDDALVAWIAETEILNRAKYGKSENEDVSSSISELLYDYEYCFAKIVSTAADGGAQDTQMQDCVAPSSWNDYDVSHDFQLSEEALNDFDDSLEVKPVHVLRALLADVPENARVETKTYYAFYALDGEKEVYVCDVLHTVTSEEAVFICDTEASNMAVIQQNPSGLTLYEGINALGQPAGKLLDYGVSWLAEEEALN